MQRDGTIGGVTTFAARLSESQIDGGNRGHTPERLYGRRSQQPANIEQFTLHPAQCLFQSIGRETNPDQLRITRLKTPIDEFRSSYRSSHTE